MSVRIVGIGEPAAGDDGVGILVVERLRALGLAPHCELCSLRDPSELFTLLHGAERVLVVDAVLDPARAGAVRVLAAGTLLAEGRHPMSSHGVDALAAVEIARELAGNTAFPDVWFALIGIERPRKIGDRLSAGVAAAAEEAVRLAARWVEAPPEMSLEDGDA